MNTIKSLACFLTFVFASQVHAQQPVRYELVKIAETVVLPPATPAEAFEKMQVNSSVNETKLFGPFYQRIEKIGKEINTFADKQLTQNNRNANAGEKANADGFGNMTASQQAQYLKSHPELQQSTGVSASMMEFAARMEDPTFKKKFDAMSEEEQVKLVMEYQKPSVKLAQKTHGQKGLQTAMEAARLVSEFNGSYYKGGLGNFQQDRIAKEKLLDEQEQKALEPVLMEKQKLMKRVGAGTTAGESERLKEVMAQEWAIRNKAYEKKLGLYHTAVSDLITTYKLAVKPFDDFLARVNYGESLKAANEAKELGQLAGYQEGLLREIGNIQEIAKSITVSAAEFYKEKLAAERSK